MAVETEFPAHLKAGPARFRPMLEWLARRGEPFVLSLGAVVAGLALFSLFILAVGKSPVMLFQLMYAGGFGSCAMNCCVAE